MADLFFTFSCPEIIFEEFDKDLAHDFGIIRMQGYHFDELIWHLGIKWKQFRTVIFDASLDFGVVKDLRWVCWNMANRNVFTFLIHIELNIISKDLNSW